MFQKILIANRGEIACRVMRTARRMGITTVAVYSDADRDALHVSLADEAVHIGGAASAQSYLNVPRLLQACAETGAEAVHPGYGFLSENADFADALERAGVVFIGPGRRAIEAMGDKITAKRIAEEAGVSTIPGYTDVVRDAEHAVEVAAGIGYPVMLKASAGGGGKGMRVAHDERECAEGFERASSEARSSFGDDRVFIEKFIEHPRHIEIQVLADGHGNVVYLGERECSIQRRHQKVIEEAPSPLLDADTRRAMGEQAVALARAVDYRSAGTVEFVADPRRNFYFLEMNTRLQVEHPVTEMVTGLDLVEQMLRVAAGEPLALAQDDIELNGWALECRVYAEDPLRGFLPSTGRLVRYLPPPEGEGVRVDSGVVEGGEVSMFYDPMVAKLITHADTREDAVQAMVAALDRYYVRGIETNIPFLSALLMHPRFRRGDLTTHFIAEEYGDEFVPDDPAASDNTAMVCVAAAVHRSYRDRAAGISGQLQGHERQVSDEWVVHLAGQHHPCRVVPVGGGYDVELAGRRFAVRSSWQFGQPLFLGRVNNQAMCVQVERRGVSYQLFRAGVKVDVLVTSPREAELLAHMPEKKAADLSGFLLSPMPGLLLSVAAQPGQELKAGEELAVVEAMKMENVLRASRDCVVKAVHAQIGDSLTVDQKIIEFE
jgi:propionyl-CoA carboxylase alpha chain